MNPVLQAALIALIPIACTGLIALTGFGFAALKRKIQLIKNDNVRALVSKIEHFVEVVVTDIENSERDTLVKDTENGKIPDGEGQKLKQLAIDRVKLLLGSEGKDLAGSLLGLAGDALGTYLSGLVEHKVGVVSAKTTYSTAMSGLLASLAGTSKQLDAPFASP